MFVHFDRPLVVLGIDPGLTRCGFAALQAAAKGNATKVLSLGVMRTPATDPLPHRLAQLRADLSALMAEIEPDVVVVEHVFFQVNVRTAMAVGQASGLALAEAASRGCEVVQYTPNEVKQAVTGWGAANKEQIQRMVQSRLGLTAAPKPADAADAAALALCYLAQAPMRRGIAAASTANRLLSGTAPMRPTAPAAKQLAEAMAAAASNRAHPSGARTTAAQARLRILQSGN